jgi:hypothetical protein
VAVGRATWKTPRGPFTIVEKEVDPTWDVPPSIQAEMRREGKPVIASIPPCPANPLGRYWIRLSHPGVGLHGTNAPGSIYRFTTHGCIRLHPDDVAALFERVSVGDAGLTAYDPVLLARLADGRIFAEVHQDPYKEGPDPLRHLRALAESAALTDAIDWTIVADVIRKREGVAVDVTRLAPAGITGVRACDPRHRQRLVWMGQAAPVSYRRPCDTRRRRRASSPLRVTPWSASWLRRRGFDGRPRRRHEGSDGYEEDPGSVSMSKRARRFMRLS